MLIRKFKPEESSTPDKLSLELVPQTKEEADLLREAERKIFFRLERGFSSGGKFLKSELHEAKEIDLFADLSEKSNIRLLKIREVIYKIQENINEIMKLE